MHDVTLDDNGKMYQCFLTLKNSVTIESRVGILVILQPNSKIMKYELCPWSLCNHNDGLWHRVASL